jgi:hypothetical protein
MNFYQARSGAGIVYTVQWSCVQAARPRLQITEKLNIHIYSKSSRPPLGPTQPHFQWVPGVHEPRREADHSHSSTAETKNEWSHTSAPPACLYCVFGDRYTLPFMPYACCIFQQPNHTRFDHLVKSTNHLVPRLAFPLCDQSIIIMRRRKCVP